MTNVPGRQLSSRPRHTIIELQGLTAKKSPSGKDERHWHVYLSLEHNGLVPVLKVGKTGVNGAGEPPVVSEAHRVEQRELIPLLDGLDPTGQDRVTRERIKWTRERQAALERHLYRLGSGKRMKVARYPELEHAAPAPRHRAVLVLGPGHSGKTTLLLRVAGLELGARARDLGTWQPPTLMAVARDKPWLRARDGRVYGATSAVARPGTVLNGGLAVLHLDNYPDLDASFMLHHTLADRPALSEVQVNTHAPWDSGETSAHYSDVVRGALVPVLTPTYTVTELAWFVQQRRPDLPLHCDCRVTCHGNCDWKPECTCQCRNPAHKTRTVFNVAREDAYRQYLNFPKIKQVFGNRILELPRSLDAQIEVLREIVHHQTGVRF